MFLLYQKKDKTYPESVKINGDLYSVNADFRNILRIFDMLDDKNIPGYKKIVKLTEWFFEDGLPENISPEIVVDGFVGFVDFTAKHPSPDSPRHFVTPPSEREADTLFTKEGRDWNEENGENERQFCYNFDAEEIYASFMAEYGIDLIETDFLHWYKFKILLGNLSPESAFKKKIELRFMDLSDLHDTHRLTELTRAKESVQLPDDSFEKTEDLQEIKEFNEIWGKAGNN